MRISVHGGPPPSMTSPNMTGAVASERRRTEVNETADWAALYGAARLRSGALKVEAISRALNLAPVPIGRGGQPSSAYKFVLVSLANHAGPDGMGAFPSVATLVRYTGSVDLTVFPARSRRA